METKVAVLSIIIDDLGSVERVNELFRSEMKLDELAAARRTVKKKTEE